MNLRQHTQRHRPKRDYEDEKERITIKATDSYELKEMKEKMKVIINKLAESKREKEALQKDNQSMQKEIMNLQNSLRQTISGFCNTSSEFPMPNELAANIAEFYKCDCLDIFFDLLCPQKLSMKGIIFYYFSCFSRLNELIDLYFQPCMVTIKSTGCFKTTQGPIDNVLRKAYQSTYDQIVVRIFTSQNLEQISAQLCKRLGVQDTEETDFYRETQEFMKKLGNLLLCCKICDPPLSLQIEHIGQGICFNGSQHQAFDGFIKMKEACYVVLPEILKLDGEILTKSMVLKTDYQLLD